MHLIRAHLDQHCIIWCLNLHEPCSQEVWATRPQCPMGSRRSHTEKCECFCMLLLILVTSHQMHPIGSPRMDSVVDRQRKVPEQHPPIMLPPMLDELSQWSRPEWYRHRLVRREFYVAIFWWNFRYGDLYKLLHRWDKPGLAFPLLSTVIYYIYGWRE